MNLKTNKKDLAFDALREVMNTYYPLCEETWQEIVKICEVENIKKNDYICRINEHPTFFSFVYKGLFRTYILDEKGNEYNKNFFDENTFPGSMVALLTQTESLFEVQALEDSIVIHIDFKSFRELLHKYEDLKLYQIYYLESNWLIKKDAREVEIIQQDANERYDDFIENYPKLTNRLTQYHIASHLGITPTQLSRIRKNKN